MNTLFAETHRFRSFLGNLYEPDEAASITNLVFEELFNLKAHQLKLSKERVLNPEEKSRLESILKRLLNHEPVQYVLGFAWFMDDRFLVNESTLIPRPETEELVNWILEDATGESGLSVLDLGAGSGCIAIALKKKLEGAQILAIDKSDAAIHTARINAQNILSDTKEAAFLVQDMLDAGWWDRLGMFDIIVSNPPYVREREQGEMTPQVLDFEPPQALFVPDTDPLMFYGAIAKPAFSHLSKAGRLYFEINASFGREMKELLFTLGYASELRKDMQGKDRMIKAWLPE